jgi:hypothetical protein
MTRNKRSAHILATLGIATLTLSDMGSMAHARATIGVQMQVATSVQRSAIYTAPDRSYRFAYPATWTEQRARGTDVVVMAPDRNGAVIALSYGGTTSDVKGLLRFYVNGLQATAFGTAHYSKDRLSDGSTLLTGYTLVRFAHGRVGLIAVEFVSRGGRVDALIGFVPNVSAPGWKQDVAALAQTMGSFRVAPSAATAPVSPTPVPTATASRAGAPSGGDTIHGMVTWPDGTPAANVDIELFPDGPSSWELSLPEISATTDSTGHYSSRACNQWACTNLQAWFYLKDPGGNFEHDCWLNMAGPFGYSGFNAVPGQTIDWKIQDRVCDAPLPGPPDDQRSGTEDWRWARNYLLAQTGGG